MLSLSSKLNSLSECQLQQVKDHTRKTVGDEATTSSGVGKKQCHQYDDYSSKEKVDIGKYAAENGATKSCRHFNKKLGKPVPESTAKIENRIFGCTRNLDKDTWC